MYSLPAARDYDWGTYCGIPGGIPERTTIYTTLSAGATAAQITTAITNCPTGQVVYLSAGTYNLGSGHITFGIRPGVTLRGAGAGQTILRSSGSNLVNNNYTNYTLGTAVSVSSGYTKGSTAIVLASAPSARFAAGNIIAIIEDNSPNKFATGVGTYSRDGLTTSIYDLGSEADTRNFKFLVRVTSVVGNTVNLAAPLPLDFSSSLNVRAYPPNGDGATSLCGIESLTFEDCADPIRWYNTDRCWLKDVEFDSCPDGDIGALQLNTSVQFELRRCYFHDAPGYPNQVDGMCVGVNYGVCNGLFIDNIGYRTSAMFEVNGASANAFLYNHAWDQARAAYAIPQGFPMFYSHGPVNMVNLYEGNIGFTLCEDGYHGSGCYSVAFRNNFHGRHPTYTQERKMFNLPRGTYYFSAVGNILGASSFNPTAYESTPGHDHTDSFVYSLGYPNTGNSSLTPAEAWSTYPGTYPDGAVSSTLLRHGNYDYYNDAVVNEDGEDTNLPNSLFYTTKPTYFGTLAWPPIEPTTPVANDIPAKWRWDTYAVSADLDDLFADSPSSSTYTLYIDPESRTVSAGAAASYTVNSVADDGYTGNVTLSVTGLPAGAAAEFGTNPIDSDGGTSALTITTTTGATAGVHALVLNGEEA